MRSANDAGGGRARPESARSAGEFFDGYAHDFDAIYGAKSSVVGRILDRIFRRSMLLRYQRTIAGCRPLEGKSVLDVGCGPGHYGVALARAGAARVVGIDPAAGMLEIARKHAREANVLERCEFVQGSFEEYHPGERFDYCVVMGVMDYVADPAPFVAHALELARERAFFSFPRDGGVLAAYRRRRYRNRTPLFLYPRRELEEMLAAVAPGRFTVERIARDDFVTIRSPED